MNFARSREGIYLPQYGNSHRRFSTTEWIDRTLLDNPAYQWADKGPQAFAMAMQSFGGKALIPDMPATPSVNPSFATTTVDADGEGWGAVFQAPETGSITGAGCMTGTLTVGDANTLIQLESVSLAATPGVPNGIIAAGRSATMNVNASNSWFQATFGTPYSATQGELMAITVTRQAGGALNTIFNGFPDDQSASAGIYVLPYSVVKTGASWAFGGAAGAGVFAINYGGTYYHIRGLWPFSSLSTITYSNASNPDVIGNVWIPRAKMRVNGAWLWVDADGAFAMKFIDTDGSTSLAQISYALNGRGSTSGGLFLAPFDDSAGPVNVTPTVGSTYRVGVQATTATSLSVYDYAVNSAAIMDSFPFGQNMYKSTAKSGTWTWTDTTTSRVFMGLQIDQFDDGVGGGAGNVFISCE